MTSLLADGRLVERRVFTPAAPAPAPEHVTGFGILARLHRNAFSAFPARCFTSPAIRYNLLLRDLIVAGRPETMRHVLSSGADLYRRVRIGDRVVRPLLGKGLATSDGEAWRRQRRVLAPAFTPRTLPVLTTHIVRCAEAACRYLETRRDQPLDLLPEMQALSLDIAATSMFSLGHPSGKAEIRSLLHFYASSIGRPRMSDFVLPRWALTQTDIRRRLFRRRWMRLIRGLIDERRRDPPRPGTPRDLFDMLCEAYEADDGDLLADEVSTMLFAGHETTGLTLFWACYLLANAPDWQQAVREEAQAVALTPEGASEALPRLVKTRAVVEETLRLYPPAYMSAREVAVSHEMEGVPMRQGSLVLLPFCMLHRNPDLWTSPSTFDPERFLDRQQLDRYAFLPFGAGPRTCIGAQLAISEAVLVLARLLRDNELSAQSETGVLPVGSFSTRPDRATLFKLADKLA